MTPEIKDNLKASNDILRQLKKIGRIKDRPDIWLLVDEMITRTKWLKDLIKQIIPK